MKFKGKSPFHNMKVQNDAEIADVEASVKLSRRSQKINEGRHTKQQLCSVDKMAFDWKKMPSRTFIRRSQCLASKNRLSC